MRPAFLSILLLLTLLSLGCGSTSPRVRREIALLRGEIIELENQYYTLKSMYRDETGRDPDFSAYGMPEGKTRSWRNGSGATRHCLECGEIHDPQLDYDHPLTIDSAAPTKVVEPIPADQNRTSQPDSSDSEFDQLSDPVIEIGPEEVPLPSDGQSRGFRQAGEKVSFSERGRGGQSTVNGVNPSGRAGAITDFEIDSSGTNGFEQDGSPGDDGMIVRLLPDFGNASDRRIGELTISVIDPEQSQASQRLGLWKYSSEEATQLLRSADGKLVVEARLPWQKGPAAHENLLLFVRVRTPDGRTLERSANVLIRTQTTGGIMGTEEPIEAGQSDPAIEAGRHSDGNLPGWRPIR